MLKDAGIAFIHSTDYARTRDTAQPLADLINQPIKGYDPNDLKALQATIRQLGGRHLVVGHSNTTPALVEILGGDPGVPIREADEYDRLYLLTIYPSDHTETTLLRFNHEPTSQ